MSMEGWIGVDFDATLSHYDGWKGHEFESMGPPIQLMLDRVIAWVDEGRQVKIFTARAGIPEQIPAVRQWLEAYGIGHLEITNIKDRFMYQLWDDRAIQVEPNTGKDLETELKEARLFLNSAESEIDRLNDKVEAMQIKLKALGYT